MVLGLIGLLGHLGRNRIIGWSLSVYFVVSFYIITSWTEWWYGAAFSCRPVIASYPILVLGIGAVLDKLKRKVCIIITILFVLLCAILNLFQWWQLQEGIYDPYRTTKAYYHSIFLKTKIPDNAEMLKSVERSFTAEQQWKDQYRYQLIKKIQFPKGKAKWTQEEFTKPKIRIPFNEITKKDHCWIKFEVEYEMLDTASVDGLFLVVTAIHKEKAYAYKAPALVSITDTINNKLIGKFQYLTPEMRRDQDPIDSYIWNPGKKNIKINSFKIWFYQRKF
jgi:hypothetical protein